MYGQRRVLSVFIVLFLQHGFCGDVYEDMVNRGVPRNRRVPAGTPVTETLVPGWSFPIDSAGSMVELTVPV